LQGNRGVVHVGSGRHCQRHPRPAGQEWASNRRASWHDTYSAVWKQAQRESVGVITDEEELKRYINPFSTPFSYGAGYWLTNFNEDGCSLFNPPPMNGLCKYVSKELAEKYRSQYDFQTTRTVPA
jgi:hypothetical protein